MAMAAILKMANLKAHRHILRIFPVKFHYYRTINKKFQKKKHFLKDSVVNPKLYKSLKIYPNDPGAKFLIYMHK